MIRRGLRFNVEDSVSLLGLLKVGIAHSQYNRRQDRLAESSIQVDFFISVLASQLAVLPGKFVTPRLDILGLQVVGLEL